MGRQGAVLGNALDRSRVLNLGKLANPTARMPNAANAIRDVMVHAMKLLPSKTGY
jgi:hypothetical protein